MQLSPALASQHPAFLVRTCLALVEVNLGMMLCVGPLSCIAAKKCVKQLLWQNVKIIRMLSNWKVEGGRSQSGMQNEAALDAVCTEESGTDCCFTVQLLMGESIP